MFGTTTTPGGTGGLFGQQSAGGASGKQTFDSGAPAGGGLFGSAPTPAGGNTSGSLFGGAGTGGPSMFGAGTAADPKKTGTSSMFGGAAGRILMKKPLEVACSQVELQLEDQPPPILQQEQLNQTLHQLQHRTPQQIPNLQVKQVRCLGEVVGQLEECFQV